tara:strand:+ start:1728 stop:1931 length:204 start_codon:yes stop_codon:yes gene_type:complete
MLKAHNQRTKVGIQHSTLFLPSLDNCIKYTFNKKMQAIDSAADPGSIGDTLFLVFPENGMVDANPYS